MHNSQMASPTYYDCEEEKEEEEEEEEGEGDDDGPILFG